MKLQKKVIDNYTTLYFKDGVKKYEHYKKLESELWKEYDNNGNAIHYKDSNGYEWLSDDNPKNPKNKLIDVDITPFEFNSLNS